MGEHLLGCHSARGHVGQPKVLRRFAAEALRQHVRPQHADTRDTDHIKGTCILIFLSQTSLSSPAQACKPAFCSLTLL